MPNREVFRITGVAAAAVALSLLVVLIIIRIQHVILLLGIAIFLALALEPSVSFLQRWLKSRSGAVAAMVVLLVLFIGLFFATIIPPIVAQTNSFIDNLPQLRADLEDASTPLGALERRFDITGRLQQIAAGATEGIGSLTTVFGTVAGIIADSLVVIVLATYFLLHAPKMKKEGIKLVPSGRRERTGRIVELVFDKVGGWMEGNLLISIIAGVVSFIALALIGVPYPAALAMWVAITDLIPMVGALLGAVVCVIVAFFAGIVPGVITLVFFLAYQQIENYFIGPRIMKRTVDVSAVAVIIAALIGGTLIGPLGILLAVPGAAILKVLSNEMWMPRRAAAS